TLEKISNDYKLLDLFRTRLASRRWQRKSVLFSCIKYTTLPYKLFPRTIYYILYCH
ncbi:hypothetical protein ACJX0J_012214, partial [Zea mays]